MQSGGRIISNRLGRGEPMWRHPGLSLTRHEGSGEDVHSGTGPRDREPRSITVNNVQAGSDRQAFESRGGRLGVPQKAATALDRYGRVDEVAALVAFVAGPESSYITGRISPSMAEMNA